MSVRRWRTDTYSRQFAGSLNVAKSAAAWPQPSSTVRDCGVV
jgi:hypothetical protein